MALILFQTAAVTLVVVAYAARPLLDRFRWKKIGEAYEREARRRRGEADDPDRP